MRVVERIIDTESKNRVRIAQCNLIVSVVAQPSPVRIFRFLAKFNDSDVAQRPVSLRYALIVMLFLGIVFWIWKGVWSNSLLTVYWRRQMDKVEFQNQMDQIQKRKEQQKSREQEAAQ